MKLHAVVAATLALVYGSAGGCASTPDAEIEQIQGDQVIQYETNESQSSNRTLST
ncbi:hypothetical protein [Vibrio owensii]|uniref:hypothetical protein n=1 Tax=Vibrio owensii TaxID=696485 RepID=UPI003AB0182F